MTAADMRLRMVAAVEDVDRAEDFTAALRLQLVAAVERADLAQDRLAEYAEEADRLGDRVAELEAVAERFIIVAHSEQCSGFIDTCDRCGPAWSARRGPPVPHRHRGLMTRTTLLSPRQLEVLALVAAGHSAVSVAEVLGLSEWTTRQHLRVVRERLGVHNSAAAVYRAIETGQLPCPAPPAT